MTGPLLRTKLYIPTPKPNLVPRTQLVQRLEEGINLGRRISLICAPAGFGKSTLISEWVASIDRQVAWVSLDERDSDPIQFWAYVITALQTIYPDVAADTLASLLSADPIPISEAVTNLINEVAAEPEPTVLVLDDYHSVISASVSDGLLFLIENMPPQLHIVISSRADPPWPLASMRVRGRITEVRTKDLRFSASEVKTFLKKVCGFNLSPEDVAELDNHTEGWVAGLQLAALSMQGRPDIAEFISSFTGDHRFILDYLMEEVLERQPPEVQDFMLKTSILEQLSAPLCEALSGVGGRTSDVGSVVPETAGRALRSDLRFPASDIQSMLEYLESSNLFLVPLDDVRRWYRYHHLFRDLLHSQLERTHAGLVPALYQRASQWYEQNGQISQAVGAALASGDTERVAKLVAGEVLSLVEHSQIKALRAEFERLPDSAKRSRPWLAVAHAWILVFAGQLDRVEALIEDAEWAATKMDDSQEAKHLQGYIAAVRHHATALAGDHAQSIAQARKALERLPADDLVTRSWATVSLALVLYRRGDTIAADTALARAVSLSRALEPGHIAVMVLCTLGSAQIHKGQLWRAADSFREALGLASEYTDRSGQQLPVSGYAYAYLARVLVEQNDVQAAMGYLDKGIELCERWGEPELLTGAYMCVARIRLAVNDHQGALAAIGKAKRTAQQISVWYSHRPAPLEALILLRMGDDSIAAKWADAGLDMFDGLEADHIRGQIYLAQGRLPEALATTDGLLQMAEPAEANLHVLRALILKSMVLDAQGEQDRSQAAIRQALAIAEPEGYVRSFVGMGSDMAHILRRAVPLPAVGHYAAKLLSVLESETEARSRPPHPAINALVEPLSDREMDVLQLLNTGMTSTQIAEQLYISVHTVRTHIKNIYGKLDVHSRRDAIDRAVDLGLV
jgi:LuxR family maltose regulon positive regulatory protein